MVIACSSSKDPHTMFVLKCVSKLFYKDGTGDPNFSHVFFKSKGFESVPIMNFRGSRFNVCFYNAAGTFFIHKLLLQYLLSLKNSLNFIQNAIVFFLQNKRFLTILRALGILCKLITEPYWKKTLEVSNALFMGTVYERLVFVLNLFYENPGLALGRKVSLFEGPDFYDEVSEFLFSSSFNDDLTCV